MTARPYTVPEAAALLGISVHTLRKKVTGRTVQFTRKANTRLVGFTEADIAANLAAGREEIQKPDVLARAGRRAA